MTVDTYVMQPHSPLTLEIALHYYGCCTEYDPHRLNAPAVREALDYLVDVGVLKRLSAEPAVLVPATVPPKASYDVTERGRAFVESLLRVPLPVQRWLAWDEQPNR